MRVPGLASMLCCAGLAAPATAAAHGDQLGSRSAMPASPARMFGPPSDLGALSQGPGQTPEKVPIIKRAEPPFVATPQADCGAGSRKEPGVQGRVPAGTVADGYICNLQLISHHGTSGGFKVLRYVDEKGQECAYYDTALLFPTNVTNGAGTSLGVKVLDMTDPAKPVETAALTELPMLSPHESVVLNPKRGLIAAVLGNPSTYPGLVSIYDAHADCRHPVHTFTGLIARLGHESGFSEDGKTFYATGTATTAITAIDVTNPADPVDLWEGNIVSHGMTLSDDGNRAYIADATGGDLLILDTSEIQARKPNPQAKEISRTTWTNASIPQNTRTFTSNGHPYVLEFDEYSDGTGGNSDAVGAAHIIDIADETQPKVVANLRLAVDQPTEHAEAQGDPGTFSPVQGYAAHYCDIPTQIDPTIVACSFIVSGLRVFDISDIEHPKEIAYYVHPSTQALENGYDGSNYAMSKPAFAPERKEIWYSDGGTGFNVLRVTNGMWPDKVKPPATTRCKSVRAFNARLRVRRGQRIRSATATLGGKKIGVKIVGREARVRVSLKGRKKSTVKLVIRATLANGRKLSTTRTYHPCPH